MLTSGPSGSQQSPHDQRTYADIVRQGPLDAAPAVADGGQVLASFQDQRRLREIHFFALSKNVFSP